MLLNATPTISCGAAPSPSFSSLQSNLFLTNNEHTCKRISHLLKEESRYQCQDYLKDNDTSYVTASASSSSSGSDSKSSTGDTVNAACRTRVCRWIFDTVDSMKMSHETALVAISNLDRYMSASTKARHDRREYQLASMTSLYIAIKVTESVRVKASILSRLSRGYQSEQDILRCERDMIVALRYNINGPTPFQFVGLILDLLPTTPDVHMSTKLYPVACREVELLIQDSKFVPLRRSSIAIASIVNALKKVPQAEPTIDERVQFIKSVSNAFGLDVMSSFILLGAKKKKASKRRGGCYNTISSSSSTCSSPTAEAPPQIPLCVEEERKKMKRAVSLAKHEAR